MARYKADFSQALKDFDGRPFRLGVGPEILAAINAVGEALDEGPKKKLGEKLDDIFGKEQTLGTACVRALGGAYEDEKRLGDDERIRRFNFSRKLHKGGEQEYNESERDLLKKVVGFCYPGSFWAPLIWDLLENGEKVNEDKAAGS